MKTTVLRKLFLSLLSTFVFCSSSFAQGDIPDVHLQGTLLDASGAGVGGVRITAKLDGVSEARVWAATSSADGAYVLTLPAGRYHVQFVRSPFVSRDFVLDFAAHQQRTLDVKLQLERLAASVVVTAQAEPTLAQETTASVTVITRDEIEARQSVTLPDLLLFVPGMAIGRTGAEGGSASVFLNGGNSSYTKVLVDGATVNEPGNAVDFSNFTLDNVDKVEVVRGAESAIYGTDAVAGVIQVFTHRGATRIPEFSFFGEGGSFSTGRGGGQISGLLGAFDYSAAASYFQTEGQGPNNRFLNRALSGNFGYNFGDTNQLRLTLRNNDSDAGIPGQTLLLPPNLDQHNALHFFSSSARWNFTTGPRWRHEISGAESYNHEFNSNALADFFDANDPFCAPRSPTAVPAIACDFPFVGTNKYNRSGLHAQSSYLLPKFGATAGYQYEVENGYVSALNLSHSRRNNQGGFLDFRYLPHPRTSLNFGLRAEANANFGTRVVPRAGASLALRFGKGFWGDTRLHAFYGQGIKEPRFDQTFGSNACFPGNPSLRPERSKTWSVGLEQKLASDRVIFSADYFSNRFYDVISFESTAPPPGSMCGFFGTFFNTDLARARGVNLTAVAHPLHWLSVAANYTHDDSRVLLSPNAFDPALIAGNRLIRRPPNSGSLTMNAAFRRLNVNFSGYFTGVRTDSDFLFAGLNLTRNPGYSRFDLATSYNLGRGMSLYARATNLLDKLYQDALGYPALGRDVRVGMNYRFTGRN
jgi:outer membrane cobalamin receptor